MNDHAALAIACWFRVPFRTVKSMPPTYAQRLYDAIPPEQRPEGAPCFTLNGKAVTITELRAHLRGYLGRGFIESDGASA